MSDFDGTSDTLSIGARLQSAREANGFTLDDIASKTRIPVRHLGHIEADEWNALPAITYSAGFVKSYANAVGLDGTAMGVELRERLGSSSKNSAAPLYEPADPARVPPRALAIAAGLLALFLAIGYLVWRTSAADEPDALELATAAAAAIAVPAAGPAAAPPVQPATPASTGPVAVTAADDVWLRIYESGGAKLFEGAMKKGERFEVPPTARAPQILTGRPDALRVTVGQTEIPPLGPDQRTIADVSLLPEDLLARLGTPGSATGGATAPSAPPAGIAPGPVSQ
jgi:cytoskeletal protein RodZ